MRIFNTIVTFFFFTALFLIQPLFSSTSAQTQATQSGSVATSNCVVTKIGNPAGQPVLPQECASGGSPEALKAVELARAQIGKWYLWGAPSGRNWANLDPNKGKTPNNFDCSGLTGWAWYWATNGKINMNGQTSADWNDAKGRGNTHYKKYTITDLTKIKSLLQPGDLIFWDAGKIHHTGIFSGACKQLQGDDCFIEAQKSGTQIKESHLRSGVAGFLRPVLQ